MFAVERVQTAGVFPLGFYIGAVGLDSCSSGLRARNTITNVMSGKDKLINNEGYVTDVNTIQGMVVGDDNNVAVNIADIMAELGSTAIGFGPTDPLLANQDKYPFYTQTTLDVGHQIDAIIQLFKHLKFNHVQLVYSGMEAQVSANTFQEVGGENGICVTVMHKVTTANTFEQVVQKLIDNMETKVVVVFGSKEDYRSLVSNMKEAGVAGEFVLVSDLSWGKDDSILTGLENEANNIITLSYQTPVLTAFNNYMRALNVTTYRGSNPWIGQLYEKLFDCYFDENNKGARLEPCSSNSIVDADDYQANPQSMFVILAVETIARGLDQTLQEYWYVSHSHFIFTSCYMINYTYYSRLL